MHPLKLLLVVFLLVLVVAALMNRPWLALLVAIPGVPPLGGSPH